MRDSIKDMLDFDPLGAAEELFGDSDIATVAGLAFSLWHNQDKQDLLKTMGDTHNATSVDDYIAIIKSYGFEQVYEYHFIVQYSPEEEQSIEKLFLFFHPEYGILLKMDTWRQQVNSASAYFNWSPLASNSRLFPPRASGSFDREDTGVFVGDIDAREALIYRLEDLRRCGEFITPWVERPFLWLVTYAESKEKNYDFKEISTARIEKLPEYVRARVTPAMEIVQ